jgi:hypothetical protein
MTDAPQSVPARALPQPDLSGLPRERLEDMHDAAATVLRCEAALRKSGMSVVTEVLRGQGDFTLWERYPRGDVHDAETHSQYFYHAHDPAEMVEGENGHFHLFLRTAALAPDLEPWRLRGARAPDDPEQRFVHLGALSVDARGRALRLFTTNRWVTDETFMRANAVIALLDRFEIGLAHPNYAVSEWLNAMTRLHRPHIEGLLRLRDEVVEAWEETHPEAQTLEDRRLQNVSEIALDLPAQIAALEQALKI